MTGVGGWGRRECLERLGFKGDPRLRAGMGGDLGRWRGPQTSASAISGLNRWLGWVGGQGTPQPPAASVYRWRDMGSKTDIGHQPLASLLFFFSLTCVSPVSIHSMTPELQEGGCGQEEPHALHTGPEEGPRCSTHGATVR